jgi:hypothetical protein
MLPDNSSPAAPRPHPAGLVPPGTVPPPVSLRRSRIGWAVPLLGMPLLLALSAVLAATKATPPGIGIIAVGWGLFQAVWAGGPTVTRRRQLPQADRSAMLMTGRSWTGRRTLDLSRLARVRRVKWTFSSEYGSSRRVDYVVLTDQAGASLTVLRRTAGGPVQWALDYQREHGLPQARLSRFAAIGLGLAPDNVRFRLQRTLVIFAALAAYVAVIGVLVVQVIPALAGYHGH